MSDQLTFRRIGGTGNPASLSPWPWNPGDTVLSQAAQPLGRMDFEGNGISAGLWRSNAVVVRINGHPVNEVCVVISGSVTLTDDKGHTETFGVGDGFLLPIGFSGTWSSSDDFAKIFTAVAGR